LGQITKKNSHIAKKLEITPFLDKLLQYKRNWIQHVNRMPRDRLPRVMKHYSATGRRNRGRPLKRLLDRNWIQHVNRMSRDRLPRIMKHYSATGRRNRGRPLKGLLDTWDRNGSTSGPSLWKIYDDDDDDTRYSGKYFQSSSSFLTSIIRKSSFLFTSENKEPALPTYDKYSQFHVKLVKFPAREKPRILLQATWKIDTECH